MDYSYQVSGKYFCFGFEFAKLNAVQKREPLSSLQPHPAMPKMKAHGLKA